MKKQYFMWKRGIAVVMAAALAVSGMPAGRAEASETGKPQTQMEAADIRFDFNAEPTDGKFLSGDVAAAVQGGYSLADRDAANGKSLYLDGTSGYLNVTKSDGTSPLAGLEEVTISFDTKQDRTATNWPFFAAPNANAQASSKEHYLGALVNNGTITVERYHNTNGRPKNPSAAIGNDWAHIDVVVSKTETIIYVNGLKRSAVDSSYQLTDMLGATGGIFQIGKANWKNGEFYKGWIDNFEIRGKALAESEISSDETIRAAVQADADAIQLPETVKKDFSLPSAGNNGSVIAWSVPENPYLAIEGNTAKVTPSAEGEGQVTLTAKVSKDSASGKIEVERTFSVKVEQLLDAMGTVKKQLAIANQDDIRGNINLPKTLDVEGYSGVTAQISWKSANTAVVTDTAQGGKPAGVVTRQKQDTKVKLTATIAVNGQTDTLEIEVTVKAAQQMEKTTDYLFAFFENNGGAAQQQIFLASSHDGNNWMDLNAKKAVLSVADSVRSEEDLAKNQNQAGVRDPYIIRSPEGDRFWIIATDLCIGSENIAAGTVGWGTAQFNGSHCLRIWESDDLVNWSEPWLADVSPEGTTCAWAPEAVYDESTGEYIVFFAAMTNIGNDKNVQKVYYRKTRDFRNFSEPVKLVDNGDDHIIDTTILKTEEGHYFRGSAADGSIRLEKCKDNENWKGLDTWELQGSVGQMTGFTGSGNGLEGPELFKYNEDDYKEVNGKKTVTYGLLADNYNGGRGYIPFYTTDIENAKWVRTEDNDYNFDTVHKRHGGILTLTAAEYDRIMEAYGPKTVAVKTAPATLEYDAQKGTFTPSELAITVTYANGRKEDLTYPKGAKNSRHYAFSCKEPVTAGEQEVTLTYGEKEVKFRTVVTVKGSGQEQPQEEKVLADFNFNAEGTGFTSANAKAEGTHSLKDSYAASMGKALYLDGSATNFLTVTDKDGKSLLAGTKELTVSYDMKPDRTSANWSFFAAADANKPTYKSEKYLGILENNGTTTVERYYNNGERPTNPSVSTGSSWYHIDVVLSEDKTVIYLNGQKAAEQASAYALQDILGANGIFYIGKATWGDNGEYFKGYLDNFKVINKALDESRVLELSKDFLSEQSLLAGASVGTAPDRETALTYRGTDDHTAIFTKVDNEAKTITPYVRKGTDLTKVPVTFTLNDATAAITINGSAFTNGSTVDLSADRTVTVKSAKKEVNYTIKKPILCHNPALPGQYADPDIDYFDGRFWIFPTTDGYKGWSGTQFHAFSSEDMVTWEDEGIIMELANDNPGLNDKGVQIAKSPWAINGSAWAPTIEKRNGKYYFYYCGKDADKKSQIGVAVADHPAGPYVDKGEPLVTTQQCHDLGLKISQAIDPSIFVDDDGSAYISFGNGSNGSILGKLTPDMMGIEEGSLKQITGLSEFRESVVITKAGGKYHWTWSCDDANSPNYHVNYGVSDKLIQDDGTVKVTLKKKNLLSKDESKGILGSAHQSVVHVTDESGKDRYFMAYHRFYTPLNIFTSGDGLGVHRETCIDEITFDANGEMSITPTLEGVQPVKVKEDPPTPAEKVTVTYKAGEGGSIEGTAVQEIEKGGSTQKVKAVAKDGYQFKQWSDGNTNAERSDSNVTESKTITAQFEKKEEPPTPAEKVTVTYKAGTGGKIRGQATQEIEKGGSTSAVTAVPNSGYQFVTWSDGNKNASRTDKNVQASKTITAQFAKKTVPVSKITLDKKSLVLGQKETITLKATLKPSTASNKKITWKSSKKTVATVSSKGKVTAKKPGKATITAISANGKKATCKITIKKAPKKITLNAKSKRLKRKKTFQIKVKFPAKTASNKLSYKSSKPSVATVSATGKIKAVKKGKATITVTTFNKKKATLKITVE